MKLRTFANAVLVAALALGVIATGYCVLHGGASLGRCGVPALVAVAAAIALFLDAERRIGAAITGILCAAVLWSVDAFLATRPLSERRNRMLDQAARNAGVPRDPRTELEVVRSLRQTGADAYPAVFVGNFLGAPEWRRDSLVPLGSISGVLTVMCHERGPYVVFRADEHGFPNPPGAWSRAEPELALVGDSFTMGWCVPPDESFAGLIRARRPSTIVLGMGGSGPLMQLGMVREYLPAQKPRRVLWFYCENNDLMDLQGELSQPIVRRYLEPGFSQRLVARQADVDSALRRFAGDQERQAERDLAIRNGRTIRQKAFEILKLFHLRDRVADWRRVRTPARCCDLTTYARVAAEMKAAVESWGGTLEVVYVPGEPAVQGERVTWPPALAGDSLLATLAQLGIPSLDLRTALREYGPSRDLYVQVPNAHLTPRGHQAVASVVLKDLEMRDAHHNTPNGAR